ncbi:uncharacterized protein [Typha angustifolia]|uniref:uncharacterized protein isoform X2 n=1 Tax=Typha angustifolia TaxID=59011 RepID=UPI003C2BF9D8
MKLSAPLNCKSLEKQSPHEVADSSAQDQSTNVLSQASPPSISTESKATRRHTTEELISSLPSTEILQNIIVEGDTPPAAEETCQNKVTNRHSRELHYATITGAPMQTIAAVKGVDKTWYISILPVGAPPVNILNVPTPTPPKKITLTCEINSPASETEKRKFTRKWNYIKVVISDLKEALRAKPTSLDTAKVIEDSLEELKQFGQDIEIPMEELVCVLDKLAAEIKHHNSLDKEMVKREISSKLHVELTYLTNSYSQYLENAKKLKNTLVIHENILERVVKRYEGNDTNILEQKNKITKIKEELAAAEEELKNMEKKRSDLLAEEEECKEEAKSTISKLKSAEENINAINEKINRMNDCLAHLDEAIDREFELRKKEMLDLMDRLLELEIS